MGTVEIEAFEACRPRLMRLAYRMLGQVTEAEDAVQDAWLRWRGAGVIVEDPTAWLVRVTTRVCIDRLRAAKTRRDAYRGPWLPEPLIESMEDPVERAEEVSIAFLLALERLSPLERAVFLLHEVFDQDYGEVAETLDRSEPAVRQLAARARKHVKDARPRFTVSPEHALALAQAFAAASNGDDPQALAALLAEDAILISDGGGKRKAALRVLSGREDVLRLYQGLRWRGALTTLQSVQGVRVNGSPGLLCRFADGPAVIAIEADDAGRVAAIYMISNPDKLAHIREPRVRT
jgi:RNA polymerase sigma-70 factor (ECF subfamily)